MYSLGKSSHFSKPHFQLFFCSAFNELPVSVSDQYRWEYDRNLEEICIRYKKYEKMPESHPKYIENWNFYWLEEFYKLNENDRQASKTDFTPKWRGYWQKRSIELRDEEELEMRIKLRKRLEIAVSPEDKQKLKWIQDRDKVMIKEKSPFVPILITNEITDTVQPKTMKIEKTEKVAVHIKQLTDSDLVILFSNIDELSEELREGLLEHMNSLEKNEPERYQNLLSICLDEEDLTQKQSIESENKNEFQSIDSDDSYTLDDVVMTVHDKFDLSQN